MTAAEAAGTWKLGGDLEVARMGYGAMQLGGRNAFGPPKDVQRSAAALRTAVDLGVNHIDTSDYYGPHLVNELIRETLGTYPGADDLVLVTKVGAAALRKLHRERVLPTGSTLVAGSSSTAGR